MAAISRTVCCVFAMSCKGQCTLMSFWPIVKRWVTAIAARTTSLFLFLFLLASRHGPIDGPCSATFRYGCTTIKADLDLELYGLEAIR